MASVKRYRIQLKAGSPAEVRKSIGHRLEPEGMRMRLGEAPELDTPVEIELTYEDGGIALLGIGWVSSVDSEDTHFELEWGPASDSVLLQELFGAARPGPTSRTVRLEELESPDEVRLVPAGLGETDRFHPDLDWSIPDLALASTLGLREDEKATPVAHIEIASTPDPVPEQPTRPLPIHLPEPTPMAADSTPSVSTVSTPLARIELVRRDPREPPVPVSRSPSPEPRPLPHRATRTARGEPSGPLLGIDLGTSTLSVAALSPSGRPQLVPLEAGSVSMPSVIALAPEGDAFAGASAVRFLADHPSSGVVGAHRLLGRSYWSPTVRRIEAQLSWRPRAAPDGGVIASVERRSIALEEATALVLRRALRAVRAELGGAANRAVLTCPAYYGTRQRAALVESAELSGLFVERVISTCSAVAIHQEAGIEVGQRRRLLVFDLGAGTLDVAVIETDGLRFRTLAAGGHALLGGVDFDAALVQLLIDALEGQGVSPPSSSRDLSDLLSAARDGKHFLGEASRVHLPVSAEMAASSREHLSVEIARDDAEALWASIVDKALAVTRRTCQRAGVAPTELEEILVTGGQAKAPYVSARLADFFRKPCTPVSEPGAAALGAAHLGAQVDGAGVEEAHPTPMVCGEMGGRVVSVVSGDQSYPARGRLPIRFPAPVKPEIFLLEGDQSRVEGCEPFARLTFETVPTDETRPLEVELQAVLQEDGRAEFRVVSSATGRVRAHRIETAISPELMATALAAPLTEPDVWDADETSGFFEWLRKKLRR